MEGIEIQVDDRTGYLLTNLPRLTREEQLELRELIKRYPSLQKFYFGK